MDAVFTIVAKNYLSLALALGDTLSKYNSNVSFHIIVADSNSEDYEFQPLNLNYDLVSALDLGIEKEVLRDMAFKYDITEFCTSIKPFSFDFLIKKYKYDKIIYFDPDIYLFNSINSILIALDNMLCAVTPHYFTVEKNYTGIVPEELILFVGIFNLGFFGLNINHSQSQTLLNWWMSRLTNQCYADKSDGLHTDQKWMDYITSYFQNVNILQHLGCNFAIWNLHERLISFKDGEYKVSNRILMNGELQPLLFVHFAGFDLSNEKVIHKHFPYIHLNDFPELKSLYDIYRKHLIENEYDKFIRIEYRYSKFDDGTMISKFQRRLYRAVTEKGNYSTDPFSTGSKSFYYYLKINRLISYSSIDKLNERNYKGLRKKIHVLNKIMVALKILLGFDKYTLLLKFCLRYFRPENQTFLLSEIKDYEFHNENHNERSPYFVS